MVKILELLPENPDWFKARKDRQASWQENKLLFEQRYWHEDNYRINNLFKGLLESIGTAFGKKIEEARQSKPVGLIRKPHIFISFAYAFRLQDGSCFEDWVLESVAYLVKDLMAAGIACYFCEAVSKELAPRLGGNIRTFMEEGVERCDAVLFVGTETFQYKASHYKNAATQEAFAVRAEFEAGLRKIGANGSDVPVMIPCLFSGKHLDAMGYLVECIGDMKNVLQFVRNDAPDATRYSYIKDLKKLVVDLYRQQFQRYGFGFFDDLYQQAFKQFGNDCTAIETRLIDALKRGFQHAEVIEIKAKGLAQYFKEHYQYGEQSELLAICKERLKIEYEAKAKYEAGMGLGLDQQSQPVNEETFIQLALLEKASYQKTEQMQLEKARHALQTEVSADDQSAGGNQYDYHKVLPHVDSIFGEKTAIEMEMLFSDRLQESVAVLRKSKKIDAFSNLLLVGRPGSGKTTFCKKLIWLWSVGEGAFAARLRQQFDWVFWLPLRTLNAFKHDHRNLADILYAYFIQSYTGDLDPKILERVLGLGESAGLHLPRILLLLDGYDEVNVEQKALVDKVLLATNRCTLLLTSRPWSVTNEIEKHFPVQLENTGFDTAQVKFYIDRAAHQFYPEDTVQATAFNSRISEVIDTHPRIKGIAHIPLCLALICQVAHQSSAEDFTVIKSLADLYRQLVHHTIIHHRKRRLDKYYREDRKERDYQVKLLHYYSQLARQAIAEQAAPEFQEELCQRVFDELFVGEDEVTIDNLRVDCLGQRSDSVGQQNPFITFKQNGWGYFSHLTFQEYLAAVSLARELGDPKYCVLAEDFIIKNKLNPHYRFVMWYLAGLLKEDSDKLTRFFWLLLRAPRSIGRLKELPLWIECLEECEVSENLRFREPLLVYIKQYYLYFMDRAQHYFNAQYFDEGKYCADIFDNMIFILKRAPTVLGQSGLVEEIIRRVVVLEGRYNGRRSYESLLITGYLPWELFKRKERIAIVKSSLREFGAYRIILKFPLPILSVDERALIINALPLSFIDDDSTVCQKVYEVFQQLRWAELSEQERLPLFNALSSRAIDNTLTDVGFYEVLKQLPWSDLSQDERLLLFRALSVSIINKRFTVHREFYEVLKRLPWDILSETEHSLLLRALVSRVADKAFITSRQFYELCKELPWTILSESERLPLFKAILSENADSDLTVPLEVYRVFKELPLAFLSEPKYLFNILLFRDAAGNLVVRSEVYKVLEPLMSLSQSQENLLLTFNALSSKEQERVCNRSLSRIQKQLRSLNALLSRVQEQLPFISSIDQELLPLFKVCLSEIVESDVTVRSRNYELPEQLSQAVLSEPEHLTVLPEPMQALLLEGMQGDLTVHSEDYELPEQSPQAVLSEPEHLAILSESQRLPMLRALLSEDIDGNLTVHPESYEVLELLPWAVLSEAERLLLLRALLSGDEDGNIRPEGYSVLQRLPWVVLSVEERSLLFKFVLQASVDPYIYAHEYAYSILSTLPSLFLPEDFIAQIERTCYDDHYPQFIVCDNKSIAIQGDSQSASQKDCRKIYQFSPDFFRPAKTNSHTSEQVEILRAFSDYLRDGKDQHKEELRLVANIQDRLKSGEKLKDILEFILKRQPDLEGRLSDDLKELFSKYVPGIWSNRICLIM